MGKVIKGATKFTKKFLDEKLKEQNEIIIDATVGNGYDTLYLRENSNPECKIFGFDIQLKAIENTKKRLKKAGVYNNIELINDGHENFKKYIESKVNLIVYNLGYLPGSNKEITTTKDTTMESIESGMSLLDKHGLILIVSYPGHDEGYDEYKKLNQYLEEIDQKKFNVMKITYLNQINRPPVIFMIEKK